MTTIFKRYIRNTRDGFHHNSAYWIAKRKGLPMLPSHLMNVAIAMILSDATLGLTSKDALMKVEQGYAQKEFVDHLFELFKDYCFAVSPQAYIPNKGVRKGLVKSYWFKTFSHPSFTLIRDLFYVNGVKTIKPGLVTDYIDAIGLAYWIMSDGSLRDNSMTLHTQSYTKAENEILSRELNEKFGLHSFVKTHKIKYWVIKIPRSDSALLKSLIKEHMLPLFDYKIPNN